MKKKKIKKDTWLVKATYNSNNPKKYCQLHYPFTGTPKQLEKKIWNHYNNDYIEYGDNYGKAEAVEVELL